MIDPQHIRATCERWIVRGAIRTDSPLGIRTGSATKIADADATHEERWVHEIDLDHRGQPFIPASTLKGIVRSLLSEMCLPEHRRIIERLFGYAARDIDGGENAGGGAGRAEFRNAFCRDQTNGADIVTSRSAVRIDRGTGAAADGLLRTQKIVEAGTVFAVEILLDGVAEADVVFLIAALRLLDGSNRSAIGGGTRQGFGRVTWALTSETIQHLDAAAIAAWIDGDLDTDWRRAPAMSGDRLDAFQRSVSTVAWRGSSLRMSLPLELAFDGFFLVSRAADADSALGRKKEGDPDRRPLVAGRDGGSARPLLPGAGFKGPLRAQAERIWRTLTGDMSDDPQAVVTELFGGEQRSGAIRCSDFVGALMATRRHELVAIDRFTGGGADGQKFSHEVFESPVLAGELTIEIRRHFDADVTGKPQGEAPAALSAPAIGLLALVLRDLQEGDIMFGFGVRKGYGRLASATVEGLSPLTALAAKLKTDTKTGDAVVRDCVKAFRELARREPAGRVEELTDGR